MQAHFYSTNYGEVRVSENEASVLQWAEDIRRVSLEGDNPNFQRLIALADSIREACERVARYKRRISKVGAN